MRNSYSTILLLSIVAVIASVLAGTAGKFIALGVGLWLVHKRNLNYFPLIVLITAFLSTAHILYIQMFLICLTNIKLIKENKMGKIFGLFILLMIVFLSLSLYVFVTTDKNLGISMDNFSFILALIPFFYVMVLSNKENKKGLFDRLFYVLCIIMLLNFFFKLISTEFVSSRMIFFIIPFFILQIILNIKHIQHIENLKRVALSVLVLLISLNGLTFTLIFTALISYLLVSQSIVKLKLMPIIVTLFVILIPMYAIQNSDKIDFTDYNELEMNEVNDIDDLKGRVGMKLFEDRGPLWYAAWIAIATEANLYPSFEKHDLVIESKSNIEQEWEHHVHNLFLESLLRLGIILGLVVSLFYLYLNFKGYNNMIINHFSLFEKSFFASAFSVNLIGAMTGIFPLLLDFSILGLGILGLYELNKLK